MKIDNELKLKVLEIIVFLHVIHWRGVVSQCSESHAVACSWSILRMERLSTSLFPISDFLPEYNQTMLREVCSTFQEFFNCSHPFLENCDGATIKDIHFLYSAFTPICGQYFKEYILHRTCYQSLVSSYQVCQSRRQRHYDVSEHESRATKHALTCRATNQYVKCIYLTTALRCSLQAADVYFKIINQSISLLLGGTDFRCILRHPSDVISVLSTSRRTPLISTSLHYHTTTVIHVTNMSSKFTSTYFAIFMAHLCISIFTLIPH